MSKLSEIFGGLPNLAIALKGWEIPIEADFITQENIDGKITDVSNKKIIKGVIQPMSAETIQIKPEGQRAWAWYLIHINPSYQRLRVEQKLTIKGEKYKIMEVKNFIPYGFMEYHVIKDYK